MSWVGTGHGAVRTFEDAYQAASAATGVDDGQVAAFDLHQGARFADPAGLAGFASMTEMDIHVRDVLHRRMLLTASIV